MNTKFEIKTRDQLLPDDQAVFDAAKKQLGFVPNMYGVIANSPHALSRYVKAEFSASALNIKEQEIVNLVTSGVNACRYCTSFHYSYLQKLGFNEMQLAEIRNGTASFDQKLDRLVKLSKGLVENRGHIQGELVDDAIAAGYTKAAVIDIIILVNLRGVTNYVYAALGEFEIDFPAAPKID